MVPEPMADYDFQVRVLDALAELKAEQAETRTEVVNIVARLDRLNGSVARHTEQIGSLQLDQARREGASANSNKWLERLWPVIWAAAGMFFMLILLNAKHLLPALMK